MAGVDMRLSPNAYRELHWHQAGEWGYIFNGSVRVALVNEAGQSFVDDLNAGNLFPHPLLSAVGFMELTNSFEGMYGFFHRGFRIVFKHSTKGQNFYSSSMM